MQRLHSIFVYSIDGLMGDYERVQLVAREEMLFNKAEHLRGAEGTFPRESLSDVYKAGDNLDSSFKTLMVVLLKIKESQEESGLRTEMTPNMLEARKLTREYDGKKLVFLHFLNPSK